MVRIDGVNWCRVYHREVNAKLVHDVDPDCIKKQNGCGNCPNITYKVFKNGLEMDDNEGPADFYKVWRNAIEATTRISLGAKAGSVKCVICEAPCPRGQITCCDDHHEEFIQKMETQFGHYKKVTCMDTGVAFKVPIRDIIEKALKQKDLYNYPEWED